MAKYKTADKQYKYESSYARSADKVKPVIRAHTISTEIGDIALITTAEIAAEAGISQCDVAGTIYIMQVLGEIEKIRPHGVWRLLR